MTENNTTVAQNTVELSHEERRWARVLMLDVQIGTTEESFRLRMKSLKDEYIALLPVASPAQFARVLDAAANESDLPEDDKPNYLFRLSIDQEIQRKAAREARIARLSADKAGNMAGVMADDSFKLVSYKVKVGTTKTTVSARFEKSTAAKAKSSLLARLAAAKAEREEDARRAAATPPANE